MSLSQALNTSLSGLRASQTGLSLIAANIANAQTPGYVRKTLDLAATTAGGNSVRIIGVNRELDQYLQRQLRVETSGGSYADLRAQFYQRLQAVYGEPGSDSALATIFDKFTSAVQTLVTSPDSTAARSQVLSTAQVLAQALNGATTDIQALRGDAEAGLADAVATANNAMQKIAQINAQLAGRDLRDASDAALADQRDQYVDQLAQLMDIRIVENSQNQITVFTNSGVQLVGTDAAQLSFDAQGTVSAATLWDSDPAKSNLGSLMLIAGNGSAIDLIANRSIRSGKIAAYLEMRDNVLVQAQDQLDSLAATMAQALSDQSIAGTNSAPNQFDVVTAGMLNGNRINLTYTDTVTSIQHRISIIRVDDPAALPLDDSATADPNDEVIGVDFSGGMASVVAQLTTAYGGLFTFSNPSGSTLRVNGISGVSTVDDLSVTRTATALAGGDPAIAVFTDGAIPFSGFISGPGPQAQGFAGRIAVNPALLADPSKLVIYDVGTASGDPTRPNYIYDQLTGASFFFSAPMGLGTTPPFSGNLPTYLRQVLSMQGEAASNASNLAEGQAVVVNALQQRVNDVSGVSVDKEMADLIALQTAYGANARVMSAVREMLETLMQI
jgi:flagellar hook-associated protein 1 FlgK